MDREDRLQLLESLFFQALEQPVDQRAAFLDRCCANDLQLRTSLDAMIRADGERTGLIDTAPWSVQQIESRLYIPDAADPLARAGAVIGRYELVEPIGRGGMGVVWRARRSDQQNERTVAIKFIPSGLDSPRAVTRFRREERVLARLEHPHIARLYDGGTTQQGRPYFVMEFVDGVPITEFARRRELNVEERLRLFKLVCDAVQFAHGSLVLHRDLKPSNILITPDGTPKLLDFGIAKLLDDAQDGAGDVTVTDLRMLTPRYASPEQVHGAPLSVGTDVYSLGVILYELLVGRIPYSVESENRHELERAIREQDIVKPSAGILEDQSIPLSRRKALSRRLRGDIDAICMTALHKSPSHRYQSAFEFSDDIRRHLEHSSLRAKPPRIMTRIYRSIRRRKTAIVATVFGTVLGVALAATYVTRTFLLPDWREEHVRGARLAIIGHHENSDIYNVLFFTVLNWQPEFIRNAGAGSSNLEIALPEYTAALRLGNNDERVAAEAAIVRLMMAIRNESKDAIADLHALPADFKLTRTYAERIIQNHDRLLFSEDRLNEAELPDLRALGLFSLFVADLKTTIDAWVRLPLTESDPVVECLLGYVYLALNEAELAYPRLLSAYRTYPESGTIALYLADAAIRCGDIPQAEHYLGVAHELGDQDTRFAFQRVQMLILLAKGEEQEAIRLLCTEFCGRNAVAELQFARYMERKHGLEPAIRAIAGRINKRWGPGAERASWEYFVALFETWWTQCSATDRLALESGIGRHPSMTSEEFSILLRRYHSALEAMASQGAASSDSVHRMYHRERWTQVAQPANEGSLLKARAELVELALNVQHVKPDFTCAEQCSPWASSQDHTVSTQDRLVP